MKTNTLLIIALGGAALYFFTRPKPTYYPGGYYGGYQIPPSPNYKSQQWILWVQMLSKLGMDIAKMFQPGGPFYGQSQTDIYDALETDTTGWT